MKLLLWSWNVNGLRAALNKGFIEIIQKEQPDILGIQETKLQEHQIPEELNTLNEYLIYWSHSLRKGYSGTGLFTKLLPLSFSTGFGNPEFDNEGRINIAEYTEFIFFNIYFPNGQKDDERLNYKLRFYDRCLEVMEEKRTSGKIILVGGDFNTAHHPIDLANPKENEKTSGFLPIERAWLDKIAEMGWIDTFRYFDKSPEQYTWWSYRTKARPRNVGWRLDYFWVNKEGIEHIKKAGIRQDIEGSDHCPVFVELKI
ncbi:MAG: exodeoxyribonuclease III [Candidatus Cloacimonetes bacterium]|nr:exodeoxyribonuclease III [Candidatus Cloacimonadota bacterium]